MGTEHVGAGWAETTPWPRDTNHTPRAGQQCPRCRRVFREGQRLLATGREPGGRIEWVHAEHIEDPIACPRRAH